MNDMQRRRSVHSRLPDLRVNDDHTTYPGVRSLHTLRPDQIVPWNNFAADVRAITSSAIGHPPGAATLPIPDPETYLVGNELGLQGRFTETALGPVGNAIQTANPRATFGDIHCVPHEAALQDIPDVVCINIRRGNHMVGAVVELKTYRTMNLQEQDTLRVRRALGQLAHYIDEHQCRYGVISNYNQTIVAKRVGRYTFALSPIIPHGAISTANPVTISAKEALLFVAMQVRSNSWRWDHPPVGPELTEG
ncbi:hypothetical protein BO70DRAFT_396321 [Aspergillus terreus]|uniref:Uncharacterized protein n=1 Tax=Aspergillus terreus TaxID=33178 RepID=A0A5M3ZG87_ASPTE|nr:hypothetical protein ATETN484_0014024900 [Aspergillus terreus]GFF20915.1 hypothetical protein BO70DRAFT_396321 [Aspergillus terreus]